jgi:hypothetical protein
LRRVPARGIPAVARLESDRVDSVLDATHLLCTDDDRHEDARPARIVTHHGTLNDDPGFYDSFDRRADGVVKAVLYP